MSMCRRSVSLSGKGILAVQYRSPPATCYSLVGPAYLIQIHPRSLANLVRRYNLSWQECAKFVGVSAYELYKQGNIDGIVDFDPGETDTIDHFYAAIVNGIESIETVREILSRIILKSWTTIIEISAGI